MTSIQPRPPLKSRWLFAPLLAIATLLVGDPAAAQGTPPRALQLISPYAAGGANDIVSRLLAEKLGEKLNGQTVVVVNKPGAGSILGSQQLLLAPPDGQTLMMADIAHGANPALRKTMPYDTLKDFAPITLVAEFPTVLLVHPSVPAATPAELVAYARQNPGKLNYSSSGFGSTNHLAAEVFKSELGLDVTHVPYQGGGEAMNALLGGQVQMLFITLPASMPHIQSGRVKALAVTSAQRWPSLPNVPSIAETVIPGFDVNLWIGLVAPAATPAERLVFLNDKVNEVLRSPAMQERIHNLGGRVAAGSREQFDQFIRKELVRWNKAIKPEMRIN